MRKFLKVGSRNRQARLGNLAPSFILVIMQIALLILYKSPVVDFEASFQKWDFGRVFHKVPGIGDWYIKQVNYADANIEKCEKCDFKVANSNSNSNSDDFMMTLMMKSLTGIIPLVRVLHTVRTRAKKVFFVDEVTLRNMRREEREITANCGATLISLGVVKLPKHHAFYPFFRWPVYFDFLFSLRLPVFRIIVYDGQDTIFQGDPFFRDFIPDNLYITVEDRVINSTAWARSTYRPYFGNLSDWRWKTRMINAGIICGGYEAMLRLIFVFLSHIDVSKIYSIRGVDQAILTKIILDDGLENISCNLKYSTIDDEYASIAAGCWGEKCIKLYPKKKFRIGEYSSTTRNITTLIVHQFDRYMQFTRTYLIACPRNGVNSTNYIRGMYDEQNISYVEDLIRRGLV